MPIFSERVRDDPSPASHGESTADFLDRVSGPYWEQVRQLVEDWFAWLCQEAQADVRSRLRSPIDSQFHAAFLELYLHESLRRAGYKVTCHPEIAGTSRRPDFLAERSGEAFILEARDSSGASKGAEARANRQRRIYDSLDKLRSPNFFLWIDVERHGEHAPSVRPLRGELERWLQTLDPDAVKLSAEAERRSDLPEFQWSKDDWRLSFRAIPKKLEARGSIGARPLGVFGGARASFVDDAGQLRTALSDKGGSYGELDLPFVVAIGASFSTEDYDVMNALYGTESVQIGYTALGEEVTRTTRQPNGYWQGVDGWKHTDVSAVVVVKNLYPALVARQVHTIWEHPAAVHTVPVLPMWRRGVVQDAVVTFAEPVVQAAESFELPDPWPSGEPFP